MLTSFYLIFLITKTSSLSSKASFTYYTSYAECCPTNPNYNPNADTEECDKYSACDYPGIFAYWNDQKSYQFVKTTNIIAFYDNSDFYGTNFNQKYAGKQITLTKNGVTFTAIIADTCGNNDCTNCCSLNSNPDTGYLVDMEYWTVMNNFGDTSFASGDILFTIDEYVGGSDGVDVEISVISGTNSWWLGFYVNNVGCTGIDSVMVKDSKSGSVYVSASKSQWNYYEVSAGSVEFQLPISVKITNSNNKILTFNNIITSYTAADYTGSGYFCTSGDALTIGDTSDIKNNTKKYVIIGVCVSVIVAFIIVIGFYVVKNIVSRKRVQTDYKNMNDINL